MAIGYVSVVVVPTLLTTLLQQQYLPEAKIFDGYRPGVMAEIKKNQENLIRWMQAHPKEAEAINPYFFVVMDDCISQVSVSER